MIEFPRLPAPAREACVMLCDLALLPRTEAFSPPRPGVEGPRGDEFTPRRDLPASEETAVTTDAIGHEEDVPDRG